MKRILRRLLRVKPGSAEGGLITRPLGGSIPVFLDNGYVVASGHDPYGPHLADDECVLDARTGRCVRDHHAAVHLSFDPDKMRGMLDRINKTRRQD